VTCTCPACGSSAWNDFLLQAERSLTSDQRILRQALDKVICAACGLVRNRVMLGRKRLETYEYDYVLNTIAGEEHIYFVEDGPHPRSKAVFDWITPHLPATAATVLEIGCGMGNLLTHLTERYPDAAVIGVESNLQAANLARQHHADIRQQFVGKDEAGLPESDVIIAYGVAEHVEDIDSFLDAIRSACHSETTVLLCVPVQDHGGYDVFFSDHIWHFTLAQFRSALSRCRFQVMTADANSPVVRGFGLIAARAGLPLSENLMPETEIQVANRDQWLAWFAEADRRIESVGTRPVALYGASEVMSLLMAYTSLSRLHIVACVDEDPKKLGTMKHGIPVHHPDYLKEHAVDAVLLTVNPRYHQHIRSKLAPIGLPVLACLG